MEQRLHPRFTVSFPSSFSTINLPSGEGNVVERYIRGVGNVVDLSIRGCRIFSLTQVHVGMALQVEIHVSKQDPPIQVTQAIVRWYRASLFGMEFMILSPGAWPRLQQIIQELERPLHQRVNISPGVALPC